MLQLGKGRALDHVVSELEQRGYSWAYRVVDSRAFGLPHRRRRVFLLASLVGDPRGVLLVDDAGQESKLVDPADVACGFYWTEGNRGIGVDVASAASHLSLRTVVGSAGVGSGVESGLGYGLG